MTRAAIFALALGLAALAVPPQPLREQLTWETLLAPYSSGTPVLGSYRIAEIHRGPDNGIVVVVRRQEDQATVEVLVVERGRWKSDHESQSFTIDYELPRSPAPDRDAVTRVLADTIASRDAGLPSPDAIPLRANDPSALPWALEMLRGVRGLVLGAGLVLLTLIGIHGSAPLCAAGAALGAMGVGLRLWGVPVLRLDLGGAWTIAAAGVLGVLALRTSAARPRSGGGSALAVTTLALVLRLALGPWAPLHVNGHGPRFVAAATHDPADIASYGPGYAELFGPIAGLAPASPDWAIFACNALLSSMLPAIALAIGRLTGLSANAAVAAAVVLAIDPVAIRMGATEAYFTPITVLCVTASLALLLAVRAMDDRRRWTATAFLVTAGLLLSQAVRLHPCAWVLAAMAPFVVLAADVRSWRLRGAMFCAAIAVCGGVLLPTSAGPLLDVLGNIRTGNIFKPEAPSLSPLFWVGVGAAIYGLLTPRRWLTLPAGLSIAALTMTRHAFAASWIWEQAYWRLYATLPLIAVLACVRPTFLARRWILVAALLALAWARFAWPIVSARSLEQLEYSWVRDQLQRLPADCRVIHVGAAGPRLLALPTYVDASRPAAAIDLHRRATVEAALAPTPCLVYVHTSLCATPEGRPACEEIESRLTLAPIARTVFRVSGEFETFSHDRDTVETHVARVEHVTP